jgi:hypothetical protein
MSDDEILYFGSSLKEILENIEEWQKDYIYFKNTNEFIHRNQVEKPEYLKDWFRI